MLYNLKKLSQEERYERYMLIQKFVAFDPYFEYLPQLTSPTNNYKKYSNKDLAGMLAAITEGVPQGSEAVRLKELYQQFCLDYDDTRNRHMIQMRTIPSTLVRGASGNDRREEKKEEVIQLPKYQKKTNSYQDKYRTNHEEQFDDVIEFETQTELEQFLAFSAKYGLKISAKHNKPSGVAQQQEEPESSKKKKKKYVKRSPQQSLRLPDEVVPSEERERNSSESKESVHCFELNVQYALVETEKNTLITYEYQWLGTLPTQIYKISLINQQLTLSGNNKLVTLTLPRSASDRTFLTFARQKDTVVRASVGWESYQGKYKLNHSVEMPLQGILLDPNKGVYFYYDETEQEWLIASRPFAQKKDEREESVDRMVRDLIEDWQADNLRHQGQVRQILMKAPQEQLYFSFLKQVSSRDKSKILKRVSLFSFLLGEKFNYSSFIKAWNRCLKYLHDKQEDFPYLMATLAKIMQLLLQKQGSVHDLFNKEEENEDIRDFIKGIFQRYHWYSKDEDVKKLVRTKNKFNDLI